MTNQGLTRQEVAQHVQKGQTNQLPDSSSRSVKDILSANVLTRFNALLTILAVTVLIVGGGMINTLFFLVAVINSFIGIFQELRAKRTLDKLSILTSPKATVIREGQVQEILISEVVQDDLIVLKLGDQIVADGVMTESSGIEMDESLLSGESHPVAKKAGDEVLSGSFVVAGSGRMQAQAVGIASYSYQLTGSAKQFKHANSELMRDTNKLLKWISWLIAVLGSMLIVGQILIGRHAWQNSIIRSIAALVGMIPNGLVMLTSLAFMIAAVSLARHQVLVQSLPSVETLARVDTLLLDKTGTLTDGKIAFESLQLTNQARREEISQVLVTLASRAESPTNSAILAGFPNSKASTFSQEIPFSSARKWSAIQIDGKNYFFGAPEMLYAHEEQLQDLKAAQSIAQEGKRVLALLESNIFPLDENEILPSDLTSVATVILSETIRPDASETLGYFAEQNVDIKVISGDSYLTVASVAEKVGLKAVKAIDARQLPDFEQSLSEFNEAINAHNVFGRVKPEQKQAIVAALQSQQHVVAMTGDGVNDALALKKADLGIAMQSGAGATRSLAEIILLDNKFSHLPSVLAEGRRVMANIERVASLFIIKNIYSALLFSTVTMFGLVYPYLPSQMTVIDALTIGIPAFFLALAPNIQIYRPGFLKRVLKFSIPIGVAMAFAMLIDYFIVHAKISETLVSGTTVSIVTMMMSVSVLTIVSWPLKIWKVVLISVSILGFILVLKIPFLATHFKYLVNWSLLPISLLIGLLGALLVFLIRYIAQGKESNRKIGKD